MKQPNAVDYISVVAVALALFCSAVSAASAGQQIVWIEPSPTPPPKVAKLVADLTHFTEIRHITTDSANQNRVHFSPNGQLFARFSADNATLRIYSMCDSRLTAELPAAADVRSFMFSPDSLQVALLHDGFVERWELVPRKQLSSSKSSEEGWKLQSFSRNWRYLAYCDKNETLGIHDYGGAKDILGFAPQMENQQLISLTFSYDGKHVLVCTAKFPGRIFETDTAKLIYCVPQRCHEPAAAKFSANGAVAVVATDAGVQFVDLSKGDVIGELATTTAARAAFAISPDGSRAAFAEDPGASMYKINDPKKAVGNLFVKGPVGRLEFLSDNEQVLVSRIATNCVNIWSPGNYGKVSLGCETPEDDDYTVIATPDRRSFIGIGKAGIIRIWANPDDTGNPLFSGSSRDAIYANAMLNAVNHFETAAKLETAQHASYHDWSLVAYEASCALLAKPNDPVATKMNDLANQNMSLINAYAINRNPQKPPLVVYGSLEITGVNPKSLAGAAQKVRLAEPVPPPKNAVPEVELRLANP
jgi:WD40 repeat protein